MAADRLPGFCVLSHPRAGNGGGECARPTENRLGHPDSSLHPDLHAEDEAAGSALVLDAARRRAGCSHPAQHLRGGRRSPIRSGARRGRHRYRAHVRAHDGTAHTVQAPETRGPDPDRAGRRRHHHRLPGISDQSLDSRRGGSKRTVAGADGASARGARMEPGRLGPHSPPCAVCAVLRRFAGLGRVLLDIGQDHPRFLPVGS